MDRKKLIIDLYGFDAVTFYNIVSRLKDTLVGETPDWTDEYRKVLTKVSSQVAEQMGFEE